MTSRFAHAALPSDTHHIRLLKFDNTAPNGSLRLSLGVYELSDDIVYNGLSYEWGGPAADKTIFINDRPFLIRKNLHSFLEILAGSEERDILFFADAICINQEDIPERNAQVQRMSNLYRQAKKVLVWLGPGSADTDLIFDLCAEEKQDTIDIQGSTGDALDKVYLRPYWTRLWIIQELFLARDATIFCGAKSASWSSFRKLPTSVKGNFVRGGFTGFEIGLGSSPTGLHTRKILGHLNRKGEEDSTLDRTLDDLVTDFGRSQCFDVRDHVYGLLGLARMQEEERRGVEIVADYSATTSTLFARLLSNMPYSLRVRDALDIFNILKLHHGHNFTWDVDIPAPIFSLTFEVGLTHLGHIRHTGKVHKSVCECCSLWNRRNGYSSYKKSGQQRQKPRGKAISEFMVGGRQMSLAAHNCGPLLSLGPYQSCITAAELCEGDKVFLMEGTKIVLVLHREAPEHASGETVERWIRGLLANTEDEDSISQAEVIFDNCLSSLPAPTDVRLAEKESKYPFDIIHEELTLRQIMVVLSQAAQHSTYWDGPL